MIIHQVADKAASARIFLCESPSNSSHCDPENTQNDLTKPPLEQKYITAPGHPLYGYQVMVVSQCTTKSEARCIIEDPKRPGFHYHFPIRWLSAQPPPEYKPIATPDPICLPMIFLDRMVQMILAKQEIWRAVKDENVEPQDHVADLGTATGEKQRKVGTKTILPGTQRSRRNRA